MAWLFQERGIYKIGFRLNGVFVKRSLRTRDGNRAKGLKARLEANLFDLEHGRISLPEGGDLLVFLLSDGRAAAKPLITRSLTLKQLFDAYFASLPDRAK